MATVTAAVTHARAMLQIEECDAWNEYLESVRHQDDFRYQDIEPWAWARLQRRLAVLAARQHALARVS